MQKQKGSDQPLVGERGLPLVQAAVMTPAGFCCLDLLEGPSPACGLGYEHHFPRS